MGRKTPPWPTYPEWTTAKFWSFIRSGLREKFNRWPPKYEAIREAKVARGKYQCASCGELFKQTEVQVDHITPTGTLKSFEDLPEFVEKMFVDTSGLQVLCKPCHQIKTNEERKANA